MPEIDEANRLWANSMPEIYERLLVPALFEPYAVDLARRIGRLQPRRVLEIAAGTGVLTTHLLELDSVESLVATDLNQAMVDAGQSRVPGARWELADALSLPYLDDEFDAVACQFGVMFFPDKAAGFAEARRVLAPGGTCQVTVWSHLADNAFAAAVTDALKRRFPNDPPEFLAAVPYGYADPEAISVDARAGGFDEVTVELVELVSPPLLARDVAEGLCTGTPLRAGLEARGDITEITATIAADVEEQLGAEPVAGRMAAYVVVASGR